MHVKVEKGAAWLGLAMLGAFFVIFWGIAGLIPPMDPGASAEQIAKVYSEHHLRLSIGLTMMILLAFLRFSASSATRATTTKLCGSPTIHGTAYRDTCNPATRSAHGR